MDIKTSVKKSLSKLNILAAHRRKIMRTALTNTAPSFLCPNCIGGILFHDLGLQFRSPTVNLMMTQTDFVKFVLDLDHYLAQELRFFEKPGFSCPCAMLDDVTIHFTHYVTAAEAEHKWHTRKQRIDRDNLFIFATERDGLTEEQIRALGSIPCRGIVVFTANAYPEIPYALQIPRYKSDGEVGNILKKSWKDESREYEHYFDFVKWFNEASGGSFDVSQFTK